MPDTIKLACSLCEEDYKKKKMDELASYIENNFDGCTITELRLPHADKVESNDRLIGYSPDRA
ncbi:MAG: hypothetical protein FJ006_09320 [Chloroflexi bacterium]|nr:hypothetical protein [Chloroflexota bacterium]